VTKPGTLDYLPSRSEARALAAGKIGLPHVVLDRGDLGSMSEIARDWADAAITDRQRDLAAEMDSFLAFLRMQLDK